MSSPTNASSPILAAKSVSAWYGNHRAVKDISLSVNAGDVLALIGPSGCGKSTFLRCLNRMHEEITGARVDGDVFYKNQNIYAPNIDAVAVRAKIGMVFQKPNPFPTMTVAENVAAGLRLKGGISATELKGRVEVALRKAALWDEVKNKLNAAGTSLSGGQQQRLCIARALAVEPEVLLMDEPTSALDPISTGRIEELMGELKKTVTIVIVTHNMQQAARISDQTAFFLMGSLVEHGDTNQIFNAPAVEETESYISGRFG